MAHLYHTTVAVQGTLVHCDIQHSANFCFHAQVDQVDLERYGNIQSYVLMS